MDILPLTMRPCSICKEPFGFRNREYRCNPCLAKRARERRALDGEKVREIERKSKAKARAADPEKHAVYNKLWKAVNPEKVKQHKSAYHGKNAKQIYEAVKVWRLKNPEAKREHAKRHYGRHKSKYHEKVIRRRAKLANDPNAYSEAAFQTKLEQYKGLCHWCAAKIGGAVHRDHVIALSLGGSNDISNIVPSCATCNLSKGAKTPLEFAGRLF